MTRFGGRAGPRYFVLILSIALVFEAGAVAPASVLAAPEQQSPEPGTARPEAPPARTELVGERTATSQTFDNHDETYTTEVSPDPIFYQPSGSTAWEPIVLGFETTSEAGKVAISDRAPVAVSLASSDAASGFVQVSDRIHQVAFRLVGGDPSAGKPVELAGVSPTINGPVADYAEVLPGVDLRLFARADGVKTFLILKRPPDQTSFTFVVDAPGLTLQADDDGSVSLIDARGQSIGRIPRPYAVDSSVSDERGGGEFSDAVGLKVASLDGQPTVVLSVDADYLAKATYPVYVDPSYDFPTGSDAYGDAFASAKYPTMNFADYARPDSPFYHEHWLGMDPTNSTNVNEVYLKFDLSSIANYTVDSATLKVFPYHQYYAPPTATTTWVNKVSATWTESGLTWNNRPASTALTSQGLVQGQYSSFAVTSTVQSWVDGSSSNYGFKLHENGNNGTYWKRLISSEEPSGNHPILSVVYHQPLATPTKPIWTNSRALTWTYSDSGGQPQSHFQAQVSTVSDFSSILSDSGVVAGAATSWSIPGGVTLTAGSLYYWRVKVKNGTGWSAWASSYLIWDVSAPTGGISLNAGAATTDTSAVRVDATGSDPNTSSVYANDGRGTTTIVAGCGSVVCGGSWASPVLGTDKANAAVVAESNSGGGTLTWHSLTVDAAATNRPTHAMDVMRDSTSATQVGVVSDDNDGFRYELRTTAGSSSFSTLAWTATSTPGSYTTQSVNLSFTVGVWYRLVIAATDSTGAGYNLWWYPTSSVQPTTPTLTTLGVYLPKPRLHLFQLASTAAPGTIWLDNTKVTQTGTTAPFGSGVTGIRFSTDGGTNWGNWTGYADSLSYTLPAGSGSKTLSAQFRDAAGNVSATLSDSITVTFANFGRQPQQSFETWDLGAGDELAVSVATGNLVVTHPLVTLPYRGGSLPLAVTYNSQDAANVGLGPGFRLNLQRRLTINGDNTVTFIDADGGRFTFTSPVTNGTVTTYTRPAGLYATLVKDTAQGIEFTLTYRDQARDKFDIVASEGLLVRAEDRHAAGVTVAYSSGTDISTVSDDTGRQVTFTWNTGSSPHRLTTIADWAWIDAGGVVQTGATGSHRNYRFFFDAGGNLIGWSDPLNTSGACPTAGTHLTCLTYAGGLLSGVSKSQTVETFSAGTLGTTTRVITSSAAYASSSRVSQVTDAAGNSTMFTPDFADRVVVSRPTITTTYGLNANAADPYAREASIWRQVDPLTEIEHRTTWDAIFPTEPATVADNATALQGTPARTLTYTYVPGSLGLLQKLVEPLTASTNRWTEYLYNASNDVTQRTVSQDGSGTLRTITRYCYEATCSTSGVGLDPNKQIDNYVDGLNGTNDTDVVTDYLYDAYGQRTRTTRHNRNNLGNVLDDRVDGSTYDSAGNQTSAIVNYVDGLVTGASYPSTVLGDAPFMYWGLGEASGTFADASGNGNTGTAVGSGLSRAVPALVSSTGDGALTFADATSYVTRSPVTGLPSAAVTAEVWFRASAFANWIDLASHNWGGSGGYGWDLYVNGSGVLTWGVWQSGSSEQHVTFPGLSTGVTYHAVGTYDGSMLRLYLNGSQVGSLAVGALTLNTTASVFTGKTDTAAGVTVDELALYPTSLAASRILAHYTTGSGGVPTDDIVPNATTLARTDLTTAYTYDTAGNQVSAADPRRAIEVAKGTSVGPDDFVTRWTYNALNQRLTETTPTTPGSSVQRTATTTYDELGEVRQATDFGGAAAITTGTEFDQDARATHTYRDPPGASNATTASEIVYDADGHVLTSKDERQYADSSLGSTSFGYDPLGRQTSVTKAAGTADPATTATAFDALDRSTSNEVGVGAAASQLSLYSYDLGGRVTETNDGFTCTRNTYDYRDLVSTAIEGLVPGVPCTGSGLRTVTNTYDAIGRLILSQVTLGQGLNDRTVDDLYDSAGNRRSTSATQSGVATATTFTLNLLDQVTVEQRSNGTWAKTTYDPAGNSTDRCLWPSSPTDPCLPAGSTFSNPQPTSVATTTFDARNQRITLVDGTTNITTAYSPDDNYQVSATYVPTAGGKEHQSVYHYDSTRHRLDLVTHQLCAIAEHPCSDPNKLQTTGSDAYAYDAADSRTQVTENNGAATLDRYYCYDAINRVVSTRSASGCSTGLLEAYTYDDAGNRLMAGSVTFSYDATGLLTSCSPSCGTLAYDAAARMTKWNGWAFEYDAEGRMTRACQSTTDCTGNFNEIGFTYDGDGHRTQIKKFATGNPVETETWDFRYQGDAVVEEKLTDAAHPSGSVVRSYLVDDTGAVVKMTRSFGDANDGTYLATWNGHGDALALWKVESSGALTLANSYTYSTWGAPTATTQNGYPDLGFRFLYVGQHDVQWDNILGLGLYYMHARHYSPTLGRFLQPDPVGAEANLYGYAGNAPTTRADPDGRYVCLVAGVFGPEALLGACGAEILFGVFAIFAASAAVNAGVQYCFRTACTLNLHLARSTVQDNRGYGLAAEVAAAVALARFVRGHIRFHVYFGTPVGKRYLDICMYRRPSDPNTAAMLCLEVKTGLARYYLKKQWWQDLWIMQTYHFPIYGVRGPGRTGLQL